MFGEWPDDVPTDTTADEVEALASDQVVQEVAIILLTRDLTGTAWLDWDVWTEQSTDDERLDALTTAAEVVRHTRERDARITFLRTNADALGITDRTNRSEETD